MTDITLPREPPDELIEKMARAICDVDEAASGGPGWGWYFRRQISRKPFYDKARAAYAALVEHLTEKTE